MVELVTKAYGSSDDHVRITEDIPLNGENGHMLAKSRIAVKKQATGEVATSMEGNAPGARAIWILPRLCATRLLQLAIHWYE
jgi:hypothetical protein